MKNGIAFVTLILIVVAGHAQNEPANLLSGKYSLEEIKEILITRANWVPFPGIENREAWHEADEEMMKGYLKMRKLKIWPALFIRHKLVKTIF